MRLPYHDGAAGRSISFPRHFSDARVRPSQRGASDEAERRHAANPSNLIRIMPAEGFEVAAEERALQSSDRLTEQEGKPGNAQSVDRYCRCRQGP